MFAGAAGAAERPVVIVGATVFDATGAAPHLANVVIQDGRILDVGPGVKAPKGAQVINAKGKALLPGFFDVHTHWTPGGEPKISPEIANAYIAAGVTTVNDFHQQPESFAPRRQWIGSMASPHVNFVARMSTPGGHGADWADTATTKWVNSPEGARIAVRELVPYKPDFIKAFADGWRYGMSADNTSMDQDTLSALVGEAHKNNLKVLTHTVTVDRGAIAGRAKVDVIAHSLQDREIDQPTVDAIKAGGTSYAPTLAVYDPAKGGSANPEARRRTEQKFGYALHNVKVLHDAGVTIALGTDAGMVGTPHGVSTLREMELLVQAGLTPSEALVVGTANSAKVLGELEDRGTIEKGKRADIVLIDGRPWENISDVRKTDRVFVDGVQVHGPGTKLPAANSQKSMPVIKAKGALIDDFEGAKGRSSIDTLRMDDMDGGIDRTVQVTQVINRTATDHALSIAAKMSAKDNANAGVIIPLSRGSVQPVDVTAYKGVRFDVRGDGSPYSLGINTLNGRWTSEVASGPEWRTVEVPFSSLQREKSRWAGTGPWTGVDVLEVTVDGGRPAGQKMWVEIDNVTFY